MVAGLINHSLDKLQVKLAKYLFLAFSSVLGTSELWYGKEISLLHHLLILLYQGFYKAQIYTKNLTIQ